MSPKPGVLAIASRHRPKLETPLSKLYILVLSVEQRLSNVLSLSPTYQHMLYLDIRGDRCCRQIVRDRHDS